MTDKDMVQALKTILGRPTRYSNQYPYNVGYYDGQYLSFDCWNMVKALVWSRGTVADNWRVGYYEVCDPWTGIGDFNGIQILNACSDVSYDMSNVQAGEYLLYEGNGHAGMYLGDGKVVECTASWGTWKVICTDMDDRGNRSFNGAYEGRWYAHGKLPSVEYSDPEPKPCMPTYSEGEQIMVNRNAHVYGASTYFASWIYEEPMTVFQQVGDRVVFSAKGYIQGAVNAWDTSKYVEEEPWHDELPEDPIEEDPLESEDPVDEGETEHISFWTRLIKAILEVIVSVFKKE